MGLLKGSSEIGGNSVSWKWSYFQKKKGRQLQTHQPNLPAHCALREVQKKQLADTPFVEKTEAREVGLHRASPWSTGPPQECKHTPTGKEPRRNSEKRLREEWKRLLIQPMYSCWQTTSHLVSFHGTLTGQWFCVNGWPIKFVIFVIRSHDPLTWPFPLIYWLHIIPIPIHRIS